MSEFEKGRYAAQCDKIDVGVQTVLDIYNELNPSLNMFIIGYRVGVKQFDQAV